MGFRSPTQEDWEASALCASTSEKIYTGCERVIAKLACEIDGERVGKDGGWHMTLLDRMRQPLHGSKAILTADTHALLDRMRSFRQRERNTYGFDLDTKLVFERSRKVILSYHGLATDVRRVLADQPDSAHDP